MKLAKYFDNFFTLSLALIISSVLFGLLTAAISNYFKSDISYTAFASSVVAAILVGNSYTTGYRKLMSTELKWKVSIYSNIVILFLSLNVLLLSAFSWQLEAIVGVLVLVVVILIPLTYLALGWGSSQRLLNNLEARQKKAS